MVCHCFVFHSGVQRLAVVKLLALIRELLPGGEKAEHMLVSSGKRVIQITRYNNNDNDVVVAIGKRVQSMTLKEAGEYIDGTGRNI